MSISAIGSGVTPIDLFGSATQSSIRNSTSAPSAVPPSDSFRSDFAAILSAVQSGDIGAAQSALSTLQTDFQSAGAGYSPASATQSSAPAAAASTPKSDLDAMIQAIKSGDIAGAQKSLAQLQTDAQARATQAGSAPAGGHHHHHHGGGVAAPATTTTTGADQNPTSSTTTLPNL